MDKNKEWMISGKIGCTFAALFARNPEKVGWKTVNIGWYDDKLVIPSDCSILSIQFDRGKDFKPFTKHEVIAWAIDNGFYVENNGDGCIGLRYKNKDIVSWVQYFGPDSHVVTRQTPLPELCLCLKMPLKSYFKVGFKGILHLAHVSVAGLSSRVTDVLWDSSFKNTEKKLGHKPTLKEGAKTTYVSYVNQGDRLICENDDSEDIDFGMSGIVLKGNRGLKLGKTYKIQSVDYSHVKDRDNEKEVRYWAKVYLYELDGCYWLKYFKKI